ncbi:MAG: OmpA family protein [Polyangiaceae bacterium]
MSTPLVRSTAHTFGRNLGVLAALAASLIALNASAEEPAKTTATPKAEVASTDPGFNGTAGATTAPPPAADKYETKWVGWNTGGKEASLGFGLFGHLGLEHRFDRSPLADSAGGDVVSDNGLLIGLDAIVRINRWFGLGLGYEHVDLGQDRQDLPNESFSEVKRGLNVLWFEARGYPLRLDPFALYISFAGGPGWQNVETSRTNIDTFGSATASSTCSGSGSAGGALRPAVGAELALLSGLTFFGEFGGDFFINGEEDLDGCATGAGSSQGIGLRAGFAFGLEKTKKKLEPGDTDKDGITDDKDACVTEPGVANPDPLKNGCPLPKDQDGDTILDPVDACITVPGVAQADPAKNGCPLPVDKDNDGIMDPEDACPEVAGIKQDDPSLHGCPDKDGDQVVDKVDACVDIPGIKTQDPKTNGCPGDTDGDGIRDDVDACPKDPGKADPDPAKNGCPLVVVKENEIVINEQVQFDTGLATIKKVSDPLLDNVAKVMKDHPEITKIEVQGHTDTKGTPQGNTVLSDNRAKAVMAALVKRGIEQKRLVAKGYGQDKPIATNETEDGRAKNRRVQFIVLEKNGQPIPPAGSTTPAATKP